MPTTADIWMDISTTLLMQANCEGLASPLNIDFICFNFANFSPTGSSSPKHTCIYKEIMNPILYSPFEDDL